MTFFKENSYNIVRMLLYQFGMTVFGLIVTMAATKNDVLMLCVSIYASCMYLGLLYLATWDSGAKDRIRADAGRIKPDKLAGLKMSLFANIPNFLLVVFLLIGFLFGAVFGTHGWAQGMFVIAHLIGVGIQAMYTGIVNALIPASSNALSGFYLLAYTITPLLSLFACWFGYVMGWHERRLFGFLKKGKKNTKNKK